MGGGWAATRVAYALVCLWAHVPRVTRIADAYAADDMRFSRGPLWLDDFWCMTVPSATAVWATATTGLLGLLWGGRAAKPGLLTWLVASWLFMSAEALNIKAYDRLWTWIALGLVFAPIGERALHTKWRSPVARWLLLVLYCALYGSTGWLKLLEEPRWWTGEVLAYHLLHPWFGSFPIGVWVSDKAWLTAPMSWWTVIFEVVFPFLVFFRRLNPWLLFAGLLMHFGILSLMDVGPFSLIAVSAYPALLHPEVARGVWERWERFQATGRTGAPSAGEQEPDAAR